MWEMIDHGTMQNTSGPEFTAASSSDQPLTRADAEAGNREAQFGLAFWLAAREVPDYEQALEWYRKAAEQNHRLAQFNLAQMFSCGQGVVRDDAAAAAWMTRAAQGGDAGAQFEMGDRCERASMHMPPENNPEQRIESYKWFQLSAEQGYRDAAARCDSATMRMSRAEVTEAILRVSLFKTA